MWLCCCGTCQYSGSYSDSTFTDLSVYTEQGLPASFDTPDFHEASGRLRCASQATPYDDSEDDGYAWVQMQKPTGSGWTLSIKANVYELTEAGGFNDTSTVGVRLGSNGNVGPWVAFFGRPSFGNYAVNGDGTGAPSFSTFGTWSDGDELEMLITENSGNVDFDFKINGTSAHTHTGSSYSVADCEQVGMVCTDSAEWDNFAVVATDGT